MDEQELLIQFLEWLRTKNIYLHLVQQQVCDSVYEESDELIEEFLEQLD